jgi:hypothetical protein
MDVKQRGAGCTSQQAVITRVTRHYQPAMEQPDSVLSDREVLLEEGWKTSEEEYTHGALGQEHLQGN